MHGPLIVLVCYTLWLYYFKTSITLTQFFYKDVRPRLKNSFIYRKKTYMYIYWIVKWSLIGRDRRIEGSKLSLALEPEAAAIFCQHVPTTRQTYIGFPPSLASAKDTILKYLVVDLGGTWIYKSNKLLWKDRSTLSIDIFLLVSIVNFCLEIISPELSCSLTI